MHAAPTWMPVLTLCLVCGCASRGNIDLLESQLRQQEQRLAYANSELSQLRSELSTARRQTEGLREQLARQETRLTPEQLDLLYTATKLTINPLVTGGLDTREAPGDEELHLLATPQADNGDAIRTPGSMAISLFDLDDAHQPQRIGEWNFTADETAKHWHRGFAGVGYQFSLPWQTPPSGPNLLVKVRLTSIDGRTFDAAESISIQPPGGTPSAQQTATRSPSTVIPSDAENPFASLNREQP